jgi:hypothetical protein
MQVRKMGHRAMIARPSINIHWRQEMRAREVLVPAAQGCQDPAQEIHVILIPGQKQMLGRTML